MKNKKRRGKPSDIEIITQAQEAVHREIEMRQERTRELEDVYKKDRHMYDFRF